MSSPPLNVLYEDNHLLVVNKPAGVPTMGVGEDEESLVTLAKAYLKEKYEKPGNVYIGVVSRLDALATGVVVLARTSKAAARLTEQFRSGGVEKIYLAIVSGTPDPASGRCENWVYKDDRRQRMFVGTADSPGAQVARLTYATRMKLARGTLLEVQLETGRKHQIRLQLAELGHPIWGDKKYGSREPFAEGIALHSRRLVIEHPVKKSRLEFVAPLPPIWRKLGISENAS
jgi:23S rRNA pseudouridine1911/1915/1917 synthase